MKKILLPAVFLLLLLPTAQGQYMSFFGDSTWEYHITFITNPPLDDYPFFPIGDPSFLGVYCKTYIYYFNKHNETWWGGYFLDQSLYDFPDIPPGSTYLSEDTTTGRLYGGSGYLICDMSLSVGDTFVYSEGVEPHWLSEPAGDRNMIVDSIQYLSGRKTIFLSLLDHHDDYFFGSESPLQNFNFDIRFIEGIGATYGLFPGLSNMPAIPVDLNLRPYLALMLCLYKDDSLVYLANENLGCNQTCIYVGLEDYLHSYMNLYPNPASSYLVLDMGTGQEMDGEVTVQDMMGRVCLRQHASGRSCRISVADLPAGLYMLTYLDGKQNITRKFIKK